MLCTRRCVLQPTSVVILMSHTCERVSMCVRPWQWPQAVIYLQRPCPRSCTTPGVCLHPCPDTETTFRLLGSDSSQRGQAEEVGPPRCHTIVVQVCVTVSNKSATQDCKDTGMRGAMLPPLPESVLNPHPPPHPPDTQSLLDMCVTSRVVAPNFSGESA